MNPPKPILHRPTQPLSRWIVLILFGLLAILPLCAESVSANEAPINSTPGNPVSRELKTAVTAITPDSVTLTPTVSIQQGDAFEYVYYQDELLSELIWDMDPLVLYGAELGLSWDEGLALSFAGSAAIPGETGDIVDLDWLNLPEDGSRGLTHFATGSADLQFAYTANANALWRFTLPWLQKSGQKISVSPGLGFRYMTWKWNCVDGYQQYPSEPAAGELYDLWSSDATKTAIAGVPISYLQEWWMSELSLAVDTQVNERFAFSVFAKGSPWVFCNGVDYHYAQITDNDASVWTYGDEAWTLYFDKLSGGWLFEAGVSAKFQASRWLAFRLGWSKTWSSYLRGDTYIRESDSTTVSVSKESSGYGGGAKLEYQTISCAVVLTLR